MSSLVRNDDDSLSIVTEDDTGDCFGLSAATIDDLTLRLTYLNKEKRKRKEILSEMGRKIAMLWEKLRIPKHEQNAFTQSVRSLGMETINKGENKGEQELQRLHSLKAEMIEKLIFEARRAIDDLWKELHYSDDHRESFEAGKVQDESQFTDKLLEEHERYILLLQHK